MQEDLPADSINLLYTDVPYNMGSRYYIDEKGHYRFKGQGSDFMSQWDAMDGLWWHQWFDAAYRVIKPGGFLVTHNIDRQSDLWTYYARRNKFFPMQKLYWLFIDSFPKGVDLGLQLDKLEGVEREVVGTRKGAQSESTGRYGAWGKQDAKDQSMTHHKFLQGKMSIFDETKATSEIAKKYDGYKYGQAPLKQVLEEILVFWKEPLDSTVPREVRRHERDWKNQRPSGIHPSIFNIKDTRVQAQRGNAERWTPQLLVDTRMIPKMVDKMGHEDSFRLGETVAQINTMDDLYKDEDNWNYVKKATVEEKEWGLDDWTPKNYDPSKSKRKNTHPSPKPLALCKWVLNLFKIPNVEEMVIYDPFSGQGSIPLAAKQLGMKWVGTELDKDYHEIADIKTQFKPKQIQGSLF